MKYGGTKVFIYHVEDSPSDFSNLSFFVYDYTTLCLLALINE